MKLPASSWLVGSGCRRLALLAATVTAAIALTTLTGPSLHAGTAEKNAGKGVIMPPAPAEFHPMYLGTVTAGVKSSDVYTEGNFSIVAPVWSTLGAEGTLSGGVLFLEPYTSYGEGGEIAASLGLGYRYLFGSQPVSAMSRTDAPQAGFFEEGFFIGANAFIDMLDTQFNNQFWQLGVGIEFGTRYLEVRGNYYIPLTDRQLAEQFSTRDTFESTSTSTSQRVVGTDPYATANLVAQNVVYQTLRSTTSSTTTIERLFSRYEEGMEGWDAEAALLIPGLDQYFDLRLIGGYYSFDNQPFGPQTGGTGNVEGWKAGVEIRPVPAIILTGTWYEDDRLTGSDWTAGVQLQLPFEAGDLGDGKGFWGRVSDAFKPRRRHLAERLAEPVHRQNAAIKLAHNVELDKETSRTKTKTVTRVISQRPGQIILADDLIFVNNEGPVGNGIQEGDALANGADGTAERPFDTLQEGSNAAGSNSTTTSRLWSVYTQATGTSYDENVLVDQGSTRFTSSFIPIHGVWGKTFGGNTPRPVVNGGFLAFSFPTLVVQGYDIRGGYFDGIDTLAGIQTDNLTRLEVTDSLFTNMQTMGIEAQHSAALDFNVLIRNNEFRGFGDTVYVEATNDARVNVELLNNRVLTDDDEFDGFDIHAEDSSQMTALIDSNVFDGDLDYAIHLDSSATSTLLATIQRNVFGGDAEADFIEIDADESSTLTAFILNNAFTGEADGDFIDAEVEGDSFDMDIATMNLTISGNTFAGQDDPDFDAAIELTANSYSILNGTISNNTFDGNFAPDDGSDSEDVITLEGNGTTSQMNLEVVNNTFDGLFEDVIDGNFEDEASLELLVSGNEFFGLYNDGAVEISTADNGTGLFDIEILNNTFGGFFDGEVIDLESEGTTDVTALINGNVFSGAMFNAITAEKVNLSLFDLTVTENTFSGFFGPEAIFITGRGNADGVSMLNANVSNNLFSGFFSDAAIYVRKTGSADVNATISGNLFTSELMGVGIAVGAFGQGGANSGIDAIITGNQFLGNTYGYAMTLYSTDDAKLDAQITGNFLGSEAFAGDFIWLTTDLSGRIRATVGSNIAAAGSVVDNAFLYATSNDDSRLVVEGFDNNLALGDLTTFLELEESGTSNLKVDGTLNPAFTNQALMPLDDVSVIGDPNGSFFLNGAQIDLP
jgi:hypothetical protein